MQIAPRQNNIVPRTRSAPARTVKRKAKILPCSNQNRLKFLSGEIFDGP